MTYTKEQVIALADQLTCHPASRSIDEIEMAGDMLRDSVTQRTELADDRDTWKARAEFSYTERAKLELQRDKLQFSLENCRLFAARNRKESWALLILGFLAECGVVGSPLRDSSDHCEPDWTEYDGEYLK